jgi:hypothetical protein
MSWRMVEVQSKEIRNVQAIDANRNNQVQVCQVVRPLTIQRQGRSEHLEGFELTTFGFLAWCLVTGVLSVSQQLLGTYSGVRLILVEIRPVSDLFQKTTKKKGSVSSLKFLMKRDDCNKGLD